MKGNVTKSIDAGLKIRMLQTQLSDAEMAAITAICNGLGLKKHRFYRDAVLEKAQRERRAQLETVSPRE